MATTVKAVAYVHTSDVDPTVEKAGGDAWEALVNRCVKSAQDALDTPPAGYTPTQRNSLTDLFTSMKATHRGIRLLLRLGDTKPESLDALVLARLQLEGLYNVCLLTEGAQYVDRFVHEAWKRQYVHYLLYREETKRLDRFVNFGAEELSRLLKLAAIWNVTEGQRLTVEYHQLGITPPPGFTPQAIENFPTPGRVIRLIPVGPKRKMLERLYPEYQELCAYAHGRPVAGFGKTVLDDRSPTRALFGEPNVHKIFEQQVQAATQVYSVLSVAQSAVELMALYPNDMEIVKSAADAWSEIHDSHILASAIWNIRTKGFFGVVG